MAKRPSATEWWALGAILTLMVTILVSLAAETGVTVDEPSHLVSSYLYWRGADRLAPGDMPPLIKIVGGWVPALTGLPLPEPNHEVWRTGHEWSVSLQMMYGLGASEIRRVFYYSRLPMIVFPVGCCVLLWWWGRQIFSPATGILVALLFSLSPTVLAHGALFKNDLAATFGYLLFWYRAWRFWREPSRTTVTWLAASLLLAVLTKFSLLILAVIAPLLVVTRLATWKPFPWRRLAGWCALLVLIPWAGTVAAWQFELGRPSDQQFQEWEREANVPAPLVELVRVASWLPSPARMWTGAVSIVQSSAGETAVYLMGHVREGGSPLYFLTALAVKVPGPIQILILVGLAVCLAELVRRRIRGADLFWAAPAFLYLGIASMTNLQLGVRLILPALAFLILISGRGLEWLCSRRVARVVPAVLVLWLGARDVSAYPHYLAFFNPWAGGPDHGIEWLSDSNLDWGQDMRRLADFVRENRIPKIRLAYFGTDNPYAYLTDKTLEQEVPPWREDLVGTEHLEPKPGYYAISATLLSGQFFTPKYRDYFGAFRSLQPIGKAGYSIFIYKVP